MFIAYALRLTGVPIKWQLYSWSSMILLLIYTNASKKLWNLLTSYASEHSSSNDTKYSMVYSPYLKLNIHVTAFWWATLISLKSTTWSAPWVKTTHSWKWNLCQNISVIHVPIWHSRFSLTHSHCTQNSSQVKVRSGMHLVSSKSDLCS